MEIVYTPIAIAFHCDGDATGALQTERVDPLLKAVPYGFQDELIPLLGDPQ